MNQPTESTVKRTKEAPGAWITYAEADRRLRKKETYADLAKETGLSASTIRRRILKYRDGSELISPLDFL